MPTLSPLSPELIRRAGWSKLALVMLNHMLHLYMNIFK